MDAKFPDFDLEMDLTLEQKFKMRLFEKSVETIGQKEAQSLLIEASKLLMIKDNIIRSLMKKGFSV